MNTSTYRTVLDRSSAWAKGLTLATLAAGAWALSAGNAEARGNDNVYWSIGVHQPGVSVGVSNAPPVVVHQRPVYVEQRPVYVERRPVVIHQPYPYVRPVVVAPRPVYYEPRWGHGPRWDERRDRRHGRWDDRRNDRHDRWDDNGRGGDRRGDGRR
jgi:hypothetical protein